MEAVTVQVGEGGQFAKSVPDMVVENHRSCGGNVRLMEAQKELPPEEDADTDEGESFTGGQTFEATEEDRLCFGELFQLLGSASVLTHPATKHTRSRRDGDS